MFYLIPAWAHRAALPLGHLLRKVYLRLLKPEVSGVAVFITDEEGRVLLLRQSYGPRKWTMPAGGAKRGEDPALALRREVYEELGCELTNLDLLLETVEKLHGATHHVWVFRAKAASEPVADRREVLEARWFGLDDLPQQITNGVKRRLHLLEQ